MGKVFITFDEKLYEKQLEGNKAYAAGVNIVLNRLKEIVPDATSQDLVDFLAMPQLLVKRLEDTARDEYDTYVATLPDSVRSSLSFHFGKDKDIMALHRQLPVPKTYFFKVNTCRIKDGSCCFDEEALKEKCTIYGSPEMQSLWNKAQEAAKSLNALQRLMSGAGKGMKIIEDVRGLEVGLLRDEGKGYFADIDRMRELVG